MAVEHVVARLRREPFAVSDLPIAERVDQLCREVGHAWRERLLPPLVTLRLFLLQVLHGNTSIAHLRQLSGIAFAPGSYCEARTRLPLHLIQSLITTLHEAALRSASTVGTATRWLGHRILIVDSTGFSMSDTPALRARFGLPAGGGRGMGIVEGIAYPVGKVVGLLDAATGMFIRLMAVPLFSHDMRHIMRLHPLLHAGDILLGDRAFCTWAHVALLNQRGVFACFRLHHQRKSSGGGAIERWHRPRTAPVWMSRAQFLTLPPWVDVRLVCYRIDRAGYRTRAVTLATTLLDRRAWPDTKLAELYGRRWHVETCFDHLKTTMGMNILKCQSVAGVMKELAIYLLAYNLVRLAMLRAAVQQRVSVGRVSLVDACRYLCCRMLGLNGVPNLIVNPDRTGRCEPRVIRRRMKEYDLMKRPRTELRAAMNQPKTPSETC